MAYGHCRLEHTSPKALIEKHRLQKVDFHGCMFGLRTPSGELMRKAWTVVTNCPEIIEALRIARCDRSHTHAHIEGKLTYMSGFYPKEMARAIHECLRKYWNRVTGVIKSAPSVEVTMMHAVTARRAYRKPSCTI